MNLDNRQRFLTYLAATAIALWAVDTLVVAPLTRAWKERSERITQLRTQVNQGQALIGRRDSIRSRWDSMRTNTLPKEVSTAENQVLQAFYRWSSESGITISSVKPQWKNSGEDYATFECRVDASGPLSTVTKFIYDVERDPLALKVESIELSAKDNEGQQIVLGLLVSGLQLNLAE